MIIHGKRPFKQRTKQGMTLAPMRSGRFVLRMKSSLTGKRVKTDPAFKPLMADAALMKIASPLASRVYRELSIRDVKLYRKLVGKAKGMLKAGMQDFEIETQLKDELLNKKRKVKIEKHVSFRVTLYRELPVFYTVNYRFLFSSNTRDAAVFNTS